MELSAEAVRLLVVLMPGFLASIVFSHATVRRRELQWADKLIEAVLWTAIIAITSRPLGIWESIFARPVALESSAPPWTSIGLLFSTTFVLPTLAAALVNHDVYLRALNKVGLSRQRTARPVWGDAFQLRAWVTLEFADGRRVIGWPTFYPQAPEEGWLYLTQAAWIVETEAGRREVDVEGHGLLLRIDDDVKRIIFFGTG